ncbi:hypothetical protein V2J09_014950 [Rumex salicifolius]
MAKSQAHHLLLVLLFSYLICNTHAAPSTRLGGLMHNIPRVDPHLLDQDTNINIMKQQKSRSTADGRMAIELDDYAGSGANNRHTPRAAFTHGCSYC